MTLSIQFATMAAMVVSGLYLGGSLDTFRRLVPYRKPNTILTYVMEVGFWLIQAFILFFILFQMNGGELRFYIVVAVLLGFSIYQALFKNLYRGLLEKIIQWVTALYRFLRRLIEVLIITPLRWLLVLCMKILLGLGIALGTILLYTLRIILFPLKLLLKMIYRLLPKNIRKLLYKSAGFYSKIKNKCIQWVKRR
jgi:spore cortex biosynthesis protein YabQ